MCYLYIAQNKKNDRYYIGSSDDPRRRINEHNAGKTKSLKYLRPLEIVFSKEYSTPTEARRMELKLKRWKNRNLIMEIVKDQKIEAIVKGL